MKRTLTLLTALAVFAPLASFANDGAVYAIQPFNAKYDAASKTMTFTGQFAAALKQLLPPSMSVLTSMQKDLTPKYEKNFRSLFIKDAQGLGISISCTSGEVSMVGDNKSVIKELPETTCNLGVVDSKDADLGDMSSIPVKDALLKADTANKIK